MDAPLPHLSRDLPFGILGMEAEVQCYLQDQRRREVS